MGARDDYPWIAGMAQSKRHPRLAKQCDNALVELDRLRSKNLDRDVMVVQTEQLTRLVAAVDALAAKVGGLEGEANMWANR